MEFRELEMKDRTERVLFERRQFLKAFGGGIFVFFTIGDAWLSVGQFQGREYPTDFNAYLRIAEDGTVTVYSGKIEMGQGVITSLAQMAADELGVSLEAIKMVMGDTELCPWDMGTFGSMTTRFFGPAVRSAAAEARAVLLELASERLKTPKAGLSVENGVIFVTSEKSNRITFGQLAQGQRIARTMEPKPQTKGVSDFTLMGKPTTRLDAGEKVTGKAKYAGDIRLPGMLYAKILRPPAHGATLKNVDTSPAKEIPGITIVNQQDIVAVLHEDPEQAAKAIDLIKTDYDIPAAEVDNENIFDHLLERAPDGEPREQRGNLAEGEKAAAELFEQKYLAGYVAHAPIETHTALAKIENGKATVWTSTQAPFTDQRQVAQAIGFETEDVRIITPFVGGGFGGKVGGLQALQAARLAKICGKPVQVSWSRAEEFFYDSFRPASIVKVKSGIDKTGKICLWDYSVFFAGSRGSEQLYDVPHNIINVHGSWSGSTEGAHPFAVGAWRAPGANTNVFAKESQIDIMAAKAKIDPMDFRLMNTSDKRLLSVLEMAAEKFGWEKAAAPSGRGYGISCGIDAGTYIAEIVEVEVDKNSRKIDVKRVVCAQDMGIVINPAGAMMQMEGCITMGLGYALTEDIRFRGGRILDTNFDTYELPRFSQLPEIEVYLLKNDSLTPQGGGEPAIIGMGAAIANAVFDATGERICRLPLKL